MSSVFTARPAAISTFSASIVSVLPPDLDGERDAVLPHVGLRHLGAGMHRDPALPVALGEHVASTRRPRAAGCAAAPRSASPCVPKALKMSANSLPTAPAPITAIVFGAFSRNSASSELMTVVLLISSPICGMPFTREPGGDHDALGGRVHVGADLHLACPAAARPRPLMTVTLCFFIRNSTPLEFCSDDPARALHRDAVVGLDRPGLDAEILGVVRHDVGDPGAVQQRLGGDAADVDADAAELLLLDHRGGEAELRGTDGGDVARRAAAEDDHVETCHEFSI